MILQRAKISDIIANFKYTRRQNVLFHSILYLNNVFYTLVYNSNEMLFILCKLYYFLIYEPVCFK